VRDIFGIEVEVGDAIAHTSKGSRTLSIGVVLKITPKGLKVREPGDVAKAERYKNSSSSYFRAIGRTVELGYFVYEGQFVKKESTEL